MSISKIKGRTLTPASHVHPTKGASAINRLAGILATQDDWDTDPTDLANATDNNWATVTGIGEDLDAPLWIDGGYFQFDMGSIYNVLVRAKIVLGCLEAAGTTVFLNLRGSEDAATWYPCVSNYPSVQYWMTNVDIIMFILMFMRGRYLRLAVNNNNGVANLDLRLGIYEIQALDFGVA